MLTSIVVHTQIQPRSQVIFLHSSKIKSRSGLGTRPTQISIMGEDLGKSPDSGSAAELLCRHIYLPISLVIERIVGAKNLQLVNGGVVTQLPLEGKCTVDPGVHCYCSPLTLSYQISLALCMQCQVCQLRHSCMSRQKDRVKKLVSTAS